MGNKTLVMTGVSGFIGESLCKKLLYDGWNVHAIIRPNTNIEILERYLQPLNIHLYNGKLESMNNIIKSIKPVIAIHLASLFIAEHEMKDVDQLLVSNIHYGTHLLEAMVKNNVKYLINTGTTWQNYNNDYYNPVCLYAATKQAFQDIIKYYTEVRDINVITLKLFDTYGPNDRRKKLFNMLETMKNQRIEMSAGEQLMNLVHIDDVITAYQIAIKRLLHGKSKKSMEEFVVSAEKLFTLKEVVEKYCEIKKVSLNINWGGREYRTKEVMIPWLNGENIPGWFPKVQLEDGLRNL